MVYKAVALTRLVRPDANIPATTALATINKKNGRELGLQRGANVFMPNLTPLKYRRLYEIYPAKACIEETGNACNSCLATRIQDDWPSRWPRPGGAGTRTTLYLECAQSAYVTGDMSPVGKRRCVAACKFRRLSQSIDTICMGSSCFSRGNSRNIEVVQDFLKTQSLPPCGRVERAFVRRPLQIGAERHDQRQDVSRG